MSLTLILLVGGQSGTKIVDFRVLNLVARINYFCGSPKYGRKSYLHSIVGTDCTVGLTVPKIILSLYIFNFFYCFSNKIHEFGSKFSI